MATAFAAFAFLPFLLGGFPLVFLAVYLVLRWREREEAVRDPELGPKSAILFFRELAFLLVLTGATLALFHVGESMSGRVSEEETLRTGLALLVANGVVWLAANRALDRTNRRQFARPGRMFLGFTAILAGLIAILAFTVAVASLFTSSPRIELPAAATLVWGPAAVLLLRQLSRGPAAAAGGGASAPTPGSR